MSLHRRYETRWSAVRPASPGPRARDELDPRVDAELVVDAVQVGSDGGLGDGQARGDVLPSPRSPSPRSPRSPPPSPSAPFPLPPSLSLFPSGSGERAEGEGKGAEGEGEGEGRGRAGRGQGESGERAKGNLFGEPLAGRGSLRRNRSGRAWGERAARCRRRPGPARRLPQQQRPPLRTTDDETSCTHPASRCEKREARHEEIKTRTTRIGPGMRGSEPGEDDAEAGFDGVGPGLATSGPRPDGVGPRCTTSGPGRTTSGPRPDGVGPRRATSGPRPDGVGPRRATSGPRARLPATRACG
jgi:collagen type III alpha